MHVEERVELRVSVPAPDLECPRPCRQRRGIVVTVKAQLTIGGRGGPGAEHQAI